MKEILMDVSELEAPYPLYEILKKLNRLNKDEILIVKHRLYPQGLLPHLATFNHHIIRHNQNHFEIKVWKK